MEKETVFEQKNVKLKQSKSITWLGAYVFIIFPSDNKKIFSS
jgi:hypothetical protein